MEALLRLVILQLDPLEAPGTFGTGVFDPSLNFELSLLTVGEGCRQIDTLFHYAPQIERS
jgi:hypothetical protein